MNRVAEHASISRIEGAFESPDDYRTIGGIARASGLEVKEVHELLAKYPELFEKAPISLGGEPVYTFRAKEAVPVL